MPVVRRSYKLHPIHAHIMDAGVGVFRDDQRQGEKFAAVLRPAL